MDLTPEELPQRGYQPLEELPHDELVAFVRRALRHRTVATVAYWIANGLAVVALVLGVVLAIRDDGLSLGEAIARLGQGVALAFLLVPVHEGLHALAYRLVGAKQTSFDMNLRQFYFVALADRFVADTREFLVVALAPFVVVSAAVLAGVAAAPANWTLRLLGVLFTHTALCSGDFALVSYFQIHRRKGLVTFDDRAGKRTLFWQRVAP